MHVLLTNESKRDRERERKWNGVKKEKTRVKRTRAIPPCMFC